MSEVIAPLLMIGLAGVCLYHFSGQVLKWMEQNPLKVAVFFGAVAVLFLIIRFAPATGEGLRMLLVPVVCR